MEDVVWLLCPKGHVVKRLWDKDLAYPFCIASCGHNVVEMLPEEHSVYLLLGYQAALEMAHARHAWVTPFDGKRKG